MTDPASGGISSGDETASRRLPLRTTPRSATTDPWGDEADSTREADNPFAGTSLGSLPDNGSPDNPFDTSKSDQFGPFDDDDDSAAGRRARTSFPVVLGLLFSVVGACAVLTGELIMPAIALGGLGVVFSVLGMITARRRHVSGRLVAVLALLIGLAAVALAVAQHQQLEVVTWLTPTLPHRLHTWIYDKVPGLS